MLNKLCIKLTNTWEGKMQLISLIRMVKAKAVTFKPLKYWVNDMQESPSFAKGLLEELHIHKRLGVNTKSCQPNKAVKCSP